MIPNSSLIVSSTEPTGKNRKKVWMKKGRNLLDLSDIPTETLKGVTITRNEDGSITFNGTTTEDLLLRIPVYLTLFKGTYTHSITNKSEKIYFSLDNIDNTMIIPSTNSKTFILSKQTEYKEYFIWAARGITFNNYTFYPMICQGTDSTYEKYVEPKIYIKNSNDVYEKFM